jgi:hypothetical protein
MGFGRHIVTENCCEKGEGFHGMASRSCGFEKSRFRQDSGLCGIIARRTLFCLAAIRAGWNNYLDGLTQNR